jgi:hypothetical protein
LKGECRHQEKTCPTEFHRNLRPAAIAKAGRFHDTAIAPKAGEDFTELRRAEGTGRPLGAADFVRGLEKVLGRKIERRAPGRKVSNELDMQNQLRLL